MTKIKNEKGISLIEILIAFGLIGGLSLAIMRVGQNATNIQAKATKNSDLNEYITSLKRNLISSKCINAINVDKPIDDSQTSIVKEEILNFKDTYRSGTHYLYDSAINYNSYGKVKIEAMYLEIPANLDTTDTADGFKRSSEIQLAIDYNYSKNSIATKRIPMLIEYDPAISTGSNIQKCSFDFFAGDLDKEAMCQVIGGYISEDEGICVTPPSTIEIMGGMP